MIFLPENREQLFSTRPVGVVHRACKQQMLHEIDTMGADTFLAHGTESLTEFFFGKYRFDVPRLREDEVWRDLEQEIDIKPRNEIPLTGELLNEAEVLNGFRYTFHVPFDDPPAWFRIVPTTSTTSGPPFIHRLGDSELLLACETTSANAEALEMARYYSRQYPQAS